MSTQHLTPEAYAALPPELFIPGADDSHAEDVVRPSTTYWRDVWQRFKKDRLAVAGLVVIILMTLLCVVMPMVSPYTYDGSDYMNMNAGPSLAHPCGTDQLGRDQFIRIMYGARISLTIGFVAAAINFAIGVVYGGLSGYLGGRVDMVLMRIVDILSSLPSLLYIVLIMLIFGSNMGSVILALCFTSWIGTARVVRGEVMYLKHSEYVLASRLAGAGTWHLLTHQRHGAHHRVHRVSDSRGHILRGVPVLPGHRHTGAPGVLGVAGQRRHPRDADVSPSDAVSGAGHLRHHVLVQLYRRRPARRAGPPP